MRITAGDWGGDYVAKDSKEAIKGFFRDVLANRIKLVQLSPLGVIDAHKGDDSIPFRIAPALFKAGRISAETLAATFERAGLEFTVEEIAWMVGADSWMVEGLAV
jgi:hypothetical protein